MDIFLFKQMTYLYQIKTLILKYLNKKNKKITQK